MAQANIKAVITAEDRASATLQGFSSSVDSLGTTMKTVGKTAALALVAAAGAATVFAVKSAASFEQTRIGLENMLGSADNARVLLGRISKFAAETPFEFPELAQATRQLVAFGFSADDAYDTMKQLGNVSAAVGAPINDLAYLMGTLRAQGRAFTIDIRQFAMRGIPIYEYLGKVLNKNTQEITQMIEAGQIGFPEVQKAFQLLAGEGGKWGDTMNRQSKSLNGLFSTFKDTLGQVARQLVGINQAGDIMEGSLFAGLRDSLLWLNNNMTTIFSVFREAWLSVANVINTYFMPSFRAVWETLADRLFPALQRLSEALQPGFLEILKLVGTYIGALVVANIWIWINIMNVAISVVSFFIGVIAQLYQWFGNIAGAVINVARIIINNFVPVVQWFQQLPGNIRSGLGNMWEAIKGAFEDLKNNAIEWAKGTVSGIVDFFKTLPGDIKNAVTSGASGAVSSTTGFLKKMNPANLFRAEGGPVSANNPYIVGEKGPELFMPKSGGNIIPNGGFGGGGSVSINVNVGMYAGTEMEKRRVAQSLFEALKDVAASKNTTIQRMMG